MKDFKKKTVSGFAYKFAERVGAQGINFIVSMLLARLLLPEEYGVIALVTVFISILDAFVTYGFGNSLIVNKNSDGLDFSTCFYFGIALSIAIYFMVYFGAPYLADFYDNELLTPVLRVMSLRVPLAAINTVQHAYVSKHMIFKKFFYATLIGTVISGVVAVIMAYQGLGVWALVEQNLGNAFIDTLCLWMMVGWRPKWEFSFKRLKIIYDYGWKVLAVGLIDTGYRELRSLVIGKKYSSADLAYYNKGIQFPSFSNKLIEPTINTVLFPALSHCNDDKDQMLVFTRRMINVSTFILAPIMFGLAAVAEPLVVLLLTKKWVSCVVYLQIGCLAYLFRPLAIVNNTVVKASGNSALLLKLDVIKKGIGVFLLIASMQFGVLWICVSFATSNIIATIINMGANRRILGYGYRAQFRDSVPNIMIAFLMGIVVWAISLINLRPAILLIIQVVAGMCLYLGLSVITKNESYVYLLKALKTWGSKNIKKKETVAPLNENSTTTRSY